MTYSHRKQTNQEILEIEKIKNFEFIENLGFEMDFFDNNSFQITRTSRAVNIDVLAVFLGSILAITTGLFMMNNLLDYYFGYTKIDAIGIFIMLGLAFLFYHGCNFLINGWSRLMNFTNFKLIIDNGKPDGADILPDGAFYG